MSISHTYTPNLDNSTDEDGDGGGGGGGGVPFTLPPLFQLSTLLWLLSYPVLLLLGTFGNVMSIVIMRRMMTKEATINLFFIALAVGDLLVLYSGIVLKWISRGLAISIIDKWPALYFPVLCVYFSAGGFVSWILVCMTLQRAFSVAWPHHVARVFTRERVTKLIVGVAVFQTLLYIHHLFCIYATQTSSITGSQCIGLPSFSYVWFLDNVFIHLAMVLTSVLPFICLVIGNAVLVSTLITSVRKVGENISTGNSSLSEKRKRDANAVTVTIIVVSLTFIVLTLPVFIYGVLFRFKDQSKMTVQEKAEVYFLYTVSSLLSSANSAINFYLYFLTGHRFREEFVKILLCRGIKDEQA